MLHFTWIVGFLLFQLVNVSTSSNQMESTFLELDSRLKKLANNKNLITSLEEIVSKRLDGFTTKNLGTLAKSLPDGNLFKYFFRILVTMIESQSESMKNNSKQDVAQRGRALFSKKMDFLNNLLDEQII